jgi:regulator of sigma E protease
MEFLEGVWQYGIVFVVMLTVLVFVHEMGHYLVARRNGVRVEVFSIGFGPELIGWTDRAETRWKISLIPLGGYVKMFGETPVAEEPGAADTPLAPAEREVSFHHKRLAQRAAIVIAGPVANFLFAIVVFALLFSIVGQPFTAPRVDSVVPDSAAERAGLMPGDLFKMVDGMTIERFEDLQQIVSQRPETPIEIVVERDGREVRLTATPTLREFEDRFGNQHRVGQLGIKRHGKELVRHDPLTAVWQATKETARLTTATLAAVGQMITGVRPADELRGVLGIAKMTGDVLQVDTASMIWLMAYISINLGLINLFPIPMLDGGHLLFYIAEAVRGKPLGLRAQEYGFRIGLALVLTLMVFATWNDLVHLRVVDFIRGLVT